MNDPTAFDPSQAGHHHSSHNEDFPPPLPDLPPVEAPSAGFIVQLFVIPAVVVAVVIIVWLLFGKLAHGDRDAMEYIRQLRSPSANWRMAHELASLINNDPKIASDPQLLGEMCDLLEFQLEHPEDEKLTEFVTHAVGAFQTSEGKLANGQTVSPFSSLSHAIDAKYALKIRIAAAMSLAKHASREPGKVDDAKAVESLGKAAQDDSSDLRQVAVYALGFFGGPRSSEILRERIAADPDRFVRYNAAIALAGRSDSAALPTLREMLTTSQLDEVLGRVPEIVDPTERQNKLESIQLQALQTLERSISTGSVDLAQSLRPEIEGLLKSGSATIRNQAQATLQKLQGQR
jgi:hypothetical protein